MKISKAAIRRHHIDNFGSDTAQDIFLESFRKVVVGYGIGSTAKKIMMDHNLINRAERLTEKGRVLAYKMVKGEPIIE